MAPCPDCQAVNAPGTLFCLACARPLGLALAKVEAVAVASGVPGSAAVAAVLAPVALAARGLRLLALENLQPTGLALVLPDTGYSGTLWVGRTDLAQGTVVDLDLGNHGGRERRVSRRQARLRYASGLVYLADWASAHGTWLNKIKLAAGEESPLSDGDEIRFADFVFRVEVR